MQVITGLHLGVDLKLDIRDYRIGSSTGADIVLRDADVVPEHALLRVEPRAVRVEAIGGDVEYDGGTLAKGHGCKLRFPAELTLGGTRIRLTGPADPYLQAAERSWRVFQSFIVSRPVLTGAGLLLVAAVLSFAAMSVPQGMGDRKKREVSATSSVTSVSGIESAASRLRGYLADRNIDGIRVSVADNRLAVSGRVPKSAVQDWNSALKWFDETYAGRIVLASSVEIVNDGDAKGAVKLRLQAAWFGERPYIILEDGMRYFEGQVLDNGWLVKEIGEQRITLSKGDQTIGIPCQ